MPFLMKSKCDLQTQIAGTGLRRSCCTRKKSIMKYCAVPKNCTHVRWHGVTPSFMMLSFNPSQICRGSARSIVRGWVSNTIMLQCKFGVLSLRRYTKSRENF